MLFHIPDATFAILDRNAKQGHSCNFDKIRGILLRLASRGAI